MVLRPVMAPDIPVIVELDRLAFPADEQYERSFYDIMLTQGNFQNGRKTSISMWCRTK